MDERKRRQVGSPSRDAFKRKHKDLGRMMYACDLDFMLIAKVPTPDIIAAMDYKQGGDTITFTEAIAYSAIIRRGIPVFIVTGEAGAGAFRIEKFVGSHHQEPKIRLEPVCNTANWQEFERWERALRDDYTRRFGP